MVVLPSFYFPIFWVVTFFILTKVPYYTILMSVACIDAG